MYMLRRAAYVRSGVVSAGGGLLVIGVTSVTLDPHAASQLVITSRSANHVIPSCCAAAARDLLFNPVGKADPSVAALPRDDEVALRPRDDTVTRPDGLPDSSAKWRPARPANAGACDRRTTLHRVTRALRGSRDVPCDHARASRRCRGSDAARR